MSAESLQGIQSINFTTIGIVEETDDPAQAGRLKIYCPSIDHEDHKVEDLPWALYASPFGGVISNMVAGPDEDTSYGPTSYGLWAIPKQGATVLVQFINGNSNYRVWTHCLYPAMSNRGLPGGRGYDISKQKPFPVGPWTDSYEELQPAQKNLAEAGLNTRHFFTRGGYERQVAQAVTDKEGSDGYAKNPNKPNKLDSQTVSLTSAGHHFISLQDAPEFCRMRMKTTTGHQIILDDTNERIYISTAKGENWIEMDSDGHIHVFGSKSISFNSGGDFNINAGGNVNIKAGSNVNVLGSGVNITGIANIELNSGCSTLVTAGDFIELGASADLVLAGSKIHLNSKPAKQAGSASAPGIVPSHEPWNRPSSAAPRNKYWNA